MLILSVETSCDETSLAILDSKNLDFKDAVKDLQNVSVVAQVISSQIDLHALYGGVVPELGAREHAEHIHNLFSEILVEYAQSSKLEAEDELDRLNLLAKDLEYIFVTTEPGLASALRVGHEFAKTIKYFIKQKFHKEIEIVKINHLHGHVCSSFWQNNPDLDSSIVFPHLHLLVSGGNTQLIWLKSFSDFEIIGQTLDDAAGECLDKIGRMVGLDYPGGANLAKIAQTADENLLNFPISMKQSQDLNLSYSGLKTAVRYKLQKTNFKGWKFEQKLTEADIEKIKDSKPELDYLEYLKKVCVSGQSVVVQQLVNKVEQAIRLNTPKSLGLSGGVSANLLLRKKLEAICVKYNLIFLPAPKPLTGDNAVMIGLAGLVKM